MTWFSLVDHKRREDILELTTETLGNNWFSALKNLKYHDRNTTARIAA
jgi:hypothetical protein